MKSNLARLCPIVAATMLACGGLVEPLSPPANFSGVVIEFRAATTASDAALFLARSTDSAVVYLPDGAGLYHQQANGALSRVTREALTPGTHLDVWTTGVEWRSLPPQYVARQVVMR